MAHLAILCSESVIDENTSNGRLVKSLKRNAIDDIFPAHDSMSSSKRPALSVITNQPVIDHHPSKPPIQQQSDGQRYIQSSLDQLLLPPSSLPTTMATTQHSVWSNNSSLCTSGHNSSAITLSSNSFKSFGSPSSPMLLSTPESSLMCTEVVDIDQVEEDDNGCCGDYAKEIFSYLREAEMHFQPRPDYMKKQPDITSAMRAILVDWLVEVSDEFKLESQTLYMSVSLVDRFLMHMSVLRGKLQLVGASSMYLASKFEEIYPPDVGEFAYITDDTYTKKQIAKMEQIILQTLDFRLVAPTTYDFLLRYLKAASLEQRQQASPSSNQSTDWSSQVVDALSKYFCELALMNADPYLKYLPSVIAASAVCLARHTMGLNAWPSALQFYTGYMVSDIGNCLQDLHRTFAMAPQQPQQAIRQKYFADKFFRVSSFRAPETLPF